MPDQVEEILYLLYQEERSALRDDTCPAVYIDGLRFAIRTAREVRHG